MIDFTFINEKYSVKNYKKWRFDSRLDRLFSRFSPVAYEMWAVSSMIDDYGQSSYDNEIKPKIDAERATLMKHAL